MGLFTSRTKLHGFFNCWLLWRMRNRAWTKHVFHYSLHANNIIKLFPLFILQRNLETYQNRNTICILLKTYHIINFVFLLCRFIMLNFFEHWKMNEINLRNLFFCDELRLKKKSWQLINCAILVQFQIHYKHLDLGTCELYPWKRANLIPHQCT